MKKPYILLFALLVATCSPPEKDTTKQFDVLSYVAPFIGTGFHGHTFPGAVVPHGRVQLSPDTHLMGWDASSGYHYDDSTLYGFSHTHLSGTGIGDLGDILFLPFTGEIPEKKPVGQFSHDTEEASPGYYSVQVDPWNVQAELTATKRTGWHRYAYPAGSDMRLMIDLAHVLQPNWGHRVIEGSMRIKDDRTVEGYRLTNGWAAHDPIYFTCTFNKAITAHQFLADGETVGESSAEGQNVTSYLSFENDGKPLEAKVSISAVDALGAEANMQELTDFSTFDEVVAAAKKEWKRALSTIEIETEDEDVLSNFYTALYHTKIAPMTFSDIDGRYIGMDREVHAMDGKTHYTIYSLWDTFRSWYPLMTLIEPKLAGEWAADLYQHFLEGGLLPKWPLNANYTGTMVGYPAVSILSDASTKGLTEMPAEQLLESAITSSSWQPEFHEKHKGTRAERVMPEQIRYKEELGFVPIEQCRESVSYGLEMAYYDWCVAQLAELADDEETAKRYREKGQAYQQYFDSEKRFMRGIRSDGSWDPDFNPRYSNHEQSEFVEGNSYQWTPFVPHDPEGLANLMGGKEGLGIWLDSLFNTSSELVGENVSGDITGLIGQYAHGNEPSHHVPYLYRFSDRPWRTEEVIDTIMYHFYKPEPAGIIGNEDCGQMSAWYVLNALGIYQLAPGNPEFLIGRPVVEGARIKLDKGWFDIEVKNNSRINKYVASATLNGEPLPDLRFNYADIRAGGKLEITMSKTANK